MLKNGATLVRIAIGSDEQTHLTAAVVGEPRRRGHSLLPFGPLAADLTGIPQPVTPEDQWPAVARAVAEAVAAGQTDEGILFCWTGTGVSIAANKIPGIRAALCDDAETARGARLWNNANVLCLSLRRASKAVAQEILDAWFSEAVRPDEIETINHLTEIEARHTSK